MGVLAGPAGDSAGRTLNDRVEASAVRVRNLASQVEPCRTKAARDQRERQEGRQAVEEAQASSAQLPEECRPILTEVSLQEHPVASEVRAAIEKCRATAAKNAEEARNSEKARAAAMATDNANHRAEQAAVEHDKTYMRLLFSASLCRLQQARNKLTREINEEHKYGRIGGYENKSSLYYLSQRLRRTDYFLKATRAAMQADMTAAPLACTTPRVARLAQCLVYSEYFHTDDYGQEKETPPADPPGAEADCERSSVWSSLLDQETHDAAPDLD
jgi:hypothetical protein